MNIIKLLPLVPFVLSHEPHDFTSENNVADVTTDWNIENPFAISTKDFSSFVYDMSTS
jgi:hypothetical protein